jgi:Leucine-rich repeat (LRR) protein
MRRWIALAALLALAACERQGAPVAAREVSSAEVAGPDAGVLDGGGMARRVTAEGFHSLEDLKRLGASVSQIDERRSLVCDASREQCLCHEATACDPVIERCSTFAENIAEFKKALARTSGRTVTCNRAEVGRCGSLRYFYFNGDIYRDEMRWFDDKGQRVGMRSSTDYAKYCEGRVRTRWAGAIPKCTALVRDELICGSAPEPLEPFVAGWQAAASGSPASSSAPVDLGFCGRSTPAADETRLVCSSSRVSVLTPIAHLTKLETLDLNGTRVDDLAPLRGMTALRELNLRRTHVRDLAPLAGLKKLKKLNLMETSVTDLTPLASIASLEELVLGDERVDLSPLSSLPALKILATGDAPNLATIGRMVQLEELSLQGAGVVTLAPLAKLTKLQQLVLLDSSVASLAPLAGMRELKALWIMGSQVTSLAPLSGLRALEDLSISKSPVGSLRGLAGLERLEELALSQTLVVDLSLVSGLTRLRSLYVEGPVRSAAPLAGLVALEKLSLRDTSVDDLSPLVALAKLTSLTLDGSAVSDLSSLSECTGLKHLFIERTKVVDLRPLSALSGLETLRAKDTLVVDVAPLVGLKRLASVDLSGAPVRDFMPLHDSHVTTLWLRRGADAEQVEALKKARPKLRVILGPK